MTARVIHQNLPHELRCHGEEVGTILPLWEVLRDHAHIGFIDQGSALQCVAGTFSLQIMTRDAAQFVVNQRKKRVEGLAVSSTPANQQFCDLRGRARHLVSPWRAGEARCKRSITFLLSSVKKTKLQAVRQFDKSTPCQGSVFSVCCVP